MTSEEELQAQIDSLKAEVNGLKEFVRMLYNMINEDDGDDEYDPADFKGGAEVGRFNT
jgi:hypothetical protein